MRTPKLFLDFDETLFNGSLFATWLDTLFMERFQTEPQAFVQSYNEYHEFLDNGMRLYHHDRHVQAITGRPWGQVSKIVDEALQQAADLHFCYEEVHTVLDLLMDRFADMRLLTFGHEEFQHYKIGMCEALSKFNIHVVDEPKGDFLSREFTGTPGILVDDKYPLPLPSYWQHVWINREKALKQPVKLLNGTWQINSLDQLPKLLRTM